MGRLTEYFGKPGSGNTDTGGKVADGISVEYSGIEHIDAALQQLAEIERDKAVQAGLRAGGTYLVRQGRKRLRKGLKTDKAHKRREAGRQPGNLLKSFVVRLKKSRTGALVGFKRPEGAHSHLVDLGTQKRETHSGLDRGEMPSLRYWSETREQDTGTALGYVIEGIEKAATRRLSK